jgi:hypothetical protein
MTNEDAIGKLEASLEIMKRQVAELELNRTHGLIEKTEFHLASLRRDRTDAHE